MLRNGHKEKIDKMKDTPNRLTGHPAGVFVLDEVQSALKKPEQSNGFPPGELAKGIVPALSTAPYTRSLHATRDAARQVGKSASATPYSVHTAYSDKPVTDMVPNAPSPQAMLEAARAAGKTEAEINAFAASQPMKPIAIKGTRVFVQDCFGRTFGLDDVPESEIAALVKKGVPYTPYSNRHSVRTDARFGSSARNAHAPMALPPRATLRELQKRLAREAAPLRASLSPSLCAILAHIERGTKVSRREYDALVAGVAKAKESGHEFGDVLAARMPSVERAVHDASAALGIDEALVARIVSHAEAAKRADPNEVWDDPAEDAASAMIEAALNTAGTRTERLRVALDVLDARAELNAGTKGKALDRFLARYACEVENAQADW